MKLIRFAELMDEFPEIGCGGEAANRDRPTGPGTLEKKNYTPRTGTGTF
jgi:hypothetical protein